ncbi:MAG: hypothetical protein COA50_04625 [Flavobacteriaceae bacterium]|nr:MAG: hypothetical protein COA50_04625 [Flavobacteriaceae bacterium]
MKKIILAVALLGMVACQQNKIGYVDTVKIMTDYQEKIDMDAKYKVKADSFTKKRDSISQAFQIEAQAFQTRAQKLDPNKAQEEYALIQQKSQFIGQQLQQEELGIQQSNQIEMDSIVSKVKEEISAYGKANSYTYVLGGGDGGAVLYGTEADNITELVLNILNEKYKK